MDGRRHEDRDHAVECEIGAELQRGQHDDERVDDQHDLADAERDPPRHELRDDVGSAGVAAALEDQPHAESRDRPAPERREQEVVGGQVRRERRDDVDEHRERRRRRRASWRGSAAPRTRQATKSRTAFITSIWVPTGIVSPNVRLGPVVDDRREAGHAAGRDLVGDEEGVERPRGHHDAGRHQREVADPPALEHALDYHDAPSSARSRRPLPHSACVEPRPLALAQQVVEHRLGRAVHDAVLREAQLLGDGERGVEAADVQRVVRVRADRDRRARRERRLRELALARGGRDARAVRIEAVVVELEDHVVAHGGRRRSASRSSGNSSSLPGCVIWSTSGFAMTSSRTSVLRIAVGHVEAGRGMEADGDEVEALENHVGQVDAVVGLRPRRWPRSP